MSGYGVNLKTATLGTHGGALAASIAAGRMRRRLEHAERLLGAHCTGLGRGLDLEHVEAHRLGQRAALAHSHDVTLLHKEGRAAMGRDRLMALLVSPVLPDEAQVVPSDDNGAGHLGGRDNALQNAATDRHVASEGALLVNVRTLQDELNKVTMQLIITLDIGMNGIPPAPCQQTTASRKR